VAGNNSHFGRWEVNAGGGTLTFPIDHAFFPNWEGTTQVRTFSLEGAVLRYTVPTPTTGGLVRGEVIWRQATELPPPERLLPESEARPTIRTDLDVLPCRCSRHCLVEKINAYNY
jgi:hypothetical protein